MISHEVIENTIKRYYSDCQEQGSPPSYCGLGQPLGISGETVRHVVIGEYAPCRPYTNAAHPLRRIGNDDFDVVRGVFESNLRT